MNDNSVTATSLPKTEGHAGRANLVRSTAAEMGRLFTRETSKVSHVRYSIGELVHQLVTAEASYGKGLVQEVASSVGRDADTLYDYERVAAVWKRAEFDELARSKNAKGVALSFSHFVELARRNGKNGRGLDAEQRRELLELTRAECLSVKDLAEKIRARLGRAPAVFDEKPSVAQLSNATRRFITQTTALSELVEALETTPLVEHDAEQLQLTIANIEKTQSACAEMLHRLRALNVISNAQAAE